MAIDDRTWTAIGTGTLLTAGALALVGGLFWVENTAIAVPSLVVGAGLLGLGAFYPRVAGTIKISSGGVAIPIEAYRQVTETTLELETVIADKLTPRQILEVIDRALAEIQQGESGIGAVATPGVIRARSKVFEPTLVREAVEHAASTVLHATGDIATVGIVEKADVEKRGGD